MTDDSTDQMDQGHHAVVAAVLACLSVTDQGSLEFRQMRRDFDPTWNALHREISAFSVTLRQRSASIDEAIVAVKTAVLEGGPDLPPHNALRAAAVGWCVAAFHAGLSPSKL